MKNVINLKMIKAMQSKNFAGLTINPKTGEQPKTGFAVSLYGFEQTFTKVNVKTVKQYINDNKEFFAKNLFLGVWIENNNFVFDVTEIIYDLETAIKVGMLSDQRYIHSFDKDKSIKLPLRQKYGTMYQQKVQLKSDVEKTVKIYSNL